MPKTQATTKGGGSSSPLTTKGDLYTFDTVNARLAVGTDGQILKANSAIGTGLEWGTVAGTGDMVLADVQTVTGAKTFNDTKFLLRNVANTFDGSFVNANTANRIYTLPDVAGTIALTSNKLYNQSVSTPGAGFSSDTYLVGSRIANVNLPIIGTRYHILFDVTKTAAGTATPIIAVRYGTGGTTSDTALLTFTFGNGTAATDKGTFELWIHFRTVGSGTSAVITGICKNNHDGSTAGIQNLSEVVTLVAVSSGFNSTPANSGIGISVNGGTSAAWTITTVQSEYENF